jgi:hypothetical protein
MVAIVVVQFGQVLGIGVISKILPVDTVFKICTVDKGFKVFQQWSG